MKEDGKMTQEITLEKYKKAYREIKTEEAKEDSTYT